MGPPLGFQQSLCVRKSFASLTITKASIKQHQMSFGVNLDSTPVIAALQQNGFKAGLETLQCLYETPS